MKMEMYDDGNTGIAMENGFVETHAGELHVYKDRIQAGNIVFITTDNFKKYVPVEWIKKYYTDITSPYTDTRIQFEEMIRKLEKENETN